MKTLSFTMGALLAACSDNQLNAMRNDAQADAAGIEVTPARIDFGAVTDAEGVAVQAITITSVGGSDLWIEDISIDGKDAPRFHLVDEPTSFMLPAGASMTIDVAFDPGDSLEAVGQIVVTSDDPVNPVLPVDLHGADAIPLLAIEPDPADFGVVEVGCESTRSIDLVSVGDEPVTVDSIAALGDAYSLSYGFSLPRTIAPGESLSVDLTFAPPDERDFAGTLEVVSDDYDSSTRSGKQFGGGLFGSVHEESWTLEDRKADILFFVDHSCSMTDNAAALADNFGVFIEQLDDHSSDWQIVVPENASGCNVNGILSSAVVDYDTKFEDAVTTPTPSVYDESGLTVASTAVDATDPADCNGGFLREDALLHVILVSDEPEQSRETWNTYVDQLITKKGDASLVRVSAIAGTAADAAPPTDATLCYAQEGFGYAEAVAATGGTFLSICSDWAASMVALADETLSQEVFPLLQLDAIPASIAVTVDGQPASGWSFDAATNSVVFDAASTPQQGSTVVVDYATYGVCE